MREESESFSLSDAEAPSERYSQNNRDGNINMNGNTNSNTNSNINSNSEDCRDDVAGATTAGAGATTADTAAAGATTADTAAAAAATVHAKIDHSWDRRDNASSGALALPTIRASHTTYGDNSNIYSNISNNSSNNSSNNIRSKNNPRQVTTTPLSFEFNSSRNNTTTTTPTPSTTTTWPTTTPSRSKFDQWSKGFAVRKKKATKNPYKYGYLDDDEREKMTLRGFDSKKQVTAVSRARAANTVEGRSPSPSLSSYQRLENDNPSREFGYKNNHERDESQHKNKINTNGQTITPTPTSAFAASNTNTRGHGVRDDSKSETMFERDQPPQGCNNSNINSNSLSTIAINSNIYNYSDVRDDENENDDDQETHTNSHQTDQAQSDAGGGSSSASSPSMVRIRGVVVDNTTSSDCLSYGSSSSCSSSILARDNYKYYSTNIARTENVPLLKAFGLASKCIECTSCGHSMKAWKKQEAAARKKKVEAKKKQREELWERNQFYWKYESVNDNDNVSAKKKRYGRKKELDELDTLVSRIAKPTLPMPTTTTTTTLSMPMPMTTTAIAMPPLPQTNNNNATDNERHGDNAANDYFQMPLGFQLSTITEADDEDVVCVASSSFPSLNRTVPLGAGCLQQPQQQQQQQQHRSGKTTVVNGNNKNKHSSSSSTTTMLRSLLLEDTANMNNPKNNNMDPSCDPLRSKYNGFQDFTYFQSIQQQQHQLQLQQQQQLQNQQQLQLQQQQQHLQLQLQSQQQNQQHRQHWSPYANKPLPEKPFEKEGPSDLIREANEGTHLKQQQQQPPLQQQQQLPPPPKSEAKQGRNAACRRVVLKNNEIIIPEVLEETSSIDGRGDDEWLSKGEISDITEDYLHIPFSSPLYSKVLQAFREAATHRPTYYESRNDDDNDNNEGKDRNGDDHNDDGESGIEELNHLASVTL